MHYMQYKIEIIPVLYETQKIMYMIWYLPLFSDDRPWHNEHPVVDIGVIF